MDRESCACHFHKNFSYTQIPNGNNYVATQDNISYSSISSSITVLDLHVHLIKIC